MGNKIQRIIFPLLDVTDVKGHQKNLGKSFSLSNIVHYIVADVIGHKKLSWGKSFSLSN